VRSALWFALLGVACGGGGGTPDAAPDAPFVPPQCEGWPSDLTSCGGELCGNGAIDECYDSTYDHAQNCSIYSRSSEPCDGALVVTTCEQYGFYGGAGSCTWLCDFDPRACTACSTDARVQDCLALPGMVSSIATADPSTSGVPTLALMTNGGLEILSLEAQGMQHVAMGGLPKYSTGIVGIRDGWLVSFWPTLPTSSSKTGDTLQLRRYALDGAGVTLAVLDETWGSGIAYAHGPSDLTLLAWPLGGNAVFEILDGITALSVPRTLLTSSYVGGWRIRAASDGTSFFVYTSTGSPATGTTAVGELFRIAADGTVMSRTNAPGGPRGVALTFDGATGWTVGHTDERSASAQRFDSTGANVGDPLPITVDASSHLSSFIAVGNDLLYVRSTPINSNVYAHWLVRVDATGSIVNEVEVGRGVATWVDPQWGTLKPRVVATRVGASIAIAWDTSLYSHQLALVSP
jgi:hypothetical protein